MASTFLKLIAGFCRLKKIDDDGTLAAGAPFNVNGAHCSLVHNDKMATDVVFLHVQYDYVPHESEAAIYKSLLRENHLHFDGHGPGFCISPTTGRIGQITRLDLARLTPDRLASVLVKHADRLAQWRDKEWRTAQAFMDRRLPEVGSNAANQFR